MTRLARLILLIMEWRKLRDKIFGPENNGRTTANGSMDLDMWMDRQEEIVNEILEL